MRLGLEVDRLPLSSAEVKKEWSYNFRPSIRLHDVHKEDTPLALTVYPLSIYFVSKDNKLRSQRILLSYNVCFVFSNQRPARSC